VVLALQVARPGTATDPSAVGVRRFPGSYKSLASCARHTFQDPELQEAAVPFTTPMSIMAWGSELGQTSTQSAGSVSPSCDLLQIKSNDPRNMMPARWLRYTEYPQQRPRK